MVQSLADTYATVLARVQAFLPELAASNADLSRRAKEDPGSVNIECLGPHEEQYVQMVRLLRLLVCTPFDTLTPDPPLPLPPAYRTSV